MQDSTLGDSQAGNPDPAGVKGVALLNFILDTAHADLLKVQDIDNRLGSKAGKGFTPGY